MSERSKITEAEIDAKRTAAGGWSKSDLAAWGVPWPPPKGWRKALLTNGVPYVGDKESN